MRPSITILRSPRNLIFQWRTYERRVNSGKWQLFKKVGSQTKLLQQGSVGLGPKRGKFGRFGIRFRQNSWGTYYLRVIPVGVAPGVIKPKSFRPSNSVTITLKKTGKAPTISLSKVRINIDKFVVHNDADELSAGELIICVWLKYAGTKTRPVQVAYSANSGETIRPNINFTVDGTPANISIHVRALEDDVPEGLELVARHIVPTPGVPYRFSISAILRIESYLDGPCKTSSDKFNKAKGAGLIVLPAGATQSARHSFRPIHVFSNDELRFTVKGSWQIVP